MKNQKTKNKKQQNAERRTAPKHRYVKIPISIIVLIILVIIASQSMMTGKSEIFKGIRNVFVSQAKDVYNDDDDENTFTISGTVWLDKNRNGIKDEGEPGIKGIEVLLHMTGDWDTEHQRTSTSENGEYSFKIKHIDRFIRDEQTNHSSRDFRGEIEIDIGSGSKYGFTKPIYEYNEYRNDKGNIYESKYFEPIGNCFKYGNAYFESRIEREIIKWTPKGEIYGDANISLIINGGNGEEIRTSGIINAGLIEKAEVIVHHYEAIKQDDGTYKYTENKIADDEKYEGYIGDEYDTNQITDGYKLVTVSGNTSGTMEAEKTEVIYYYEKEKDEPKTKDVTVKVNWEDESNKDGVRPKEVAIYLYKSVNGGKPERVSSVDATIKLNSSNKWEHTFKDLPIYEDRNEITYTVAMNEWDTSIIENYIIENIDQETYNITLKHNTDKTDETKTDNNKTDNNKTDNNKTDNNKTDNNKKDETKSDNTKKGTTKTSESKNNNSEKEDTGTNKTKPKILPKTGEFIDEHKWVFGIVGTLIIIATGSYIRAKKMM